MLKRKITLIFLLLNIISPAYLFAAEEARQVYKETTEDPDYQYNMDTYVRYMPSRSVKSMSGKVEIIESDSQHSYAFKLFDRLPIKLSVEGKYYGINDTVYVPLPAKLTSMVWDFETALPLFFKDTYVRFGVSPSYLSDNWDFDSSNFRIPSRCYVIYMPDPKITLLAGVAIYPEYEDEVLPILGLIYRPNDKWALNLLPNRPNISYFLNDKITIFGEGGGSVNEEFEVKRRNQNGVVLRYKETHAGCGIKYKFNDNIQTSLQAGGIFGRSLQYADGEGKVVIREGFYSEFRLELKI